MPTPSQRSGPTPAATYALGRRIATDDAPDRVHRLVADVRQAVRGRRRERDRVAGLEHVLLEDERDAQAPTQHEAVLAARVARQRLGGARCAADVVDDVQELDVVVVLGREALPAHARVERDRAAVLRALHRSDGGRAEIVARAGQRPGRRSGRASSPSNSRSSTETSSSVAIAYSVPTDGCERPVSICEIRLGETPTRRASSRSVRWRIVLLARKRDPIAERRSGVRAFSLALFSCMAGDAIRASPVNHVQPS